MRGARSSLSRSASTASGSRPTCGGICGRTPRSTATRPNIPAPRKELLIGFLFALAILVPIYLVYFLLGLEAERLQAFACVPLSLFFYLFTQFAHLSRAPLSADAHGLARRAVLDDRLGLELCLARRFVGACSCSSRSASRCPGARPRSNATRCATRITAICRAASRAPAATCSSRLVAVAPGVAVGVPHDPAAFHLRRLQSDRMALVGVRPAHRRGALRIRSAISAR